MLAKITDKLPVRWNAQSVTIGSERALQSVDGDLHMTVGSKFIIAVQGSASVVDKLAYALAIDMAALSKL